MNLSEEDVKPLLKPAQEFIDIIEKKLDEKK